MSRGIPKVREWRVTLESGYKFRVLAPTKYLAVLNLRFASPAPWGPGKSSAPIWGAVAKVGAVKGTGQREMVVREG